MDRKCSFRHVKLYFPCAEDPRQSQLETLLDGELVLDHENGQVMIPRYINWFPTILTLPVEYPSLSDFRSGVGKQQKYD